MPRLGYTHIIPTRRSSDLLSSFNATIGSLAGAGDVTLGSGTLTTADNNSTLWSGMISGAGGFTKGGTGTLEFSGHNSYTGNTTNNGGTLKITSSTGLSPSN